MYFSAVVQLDDPRDGAAAHRTRARLARVDVPLDALLAEHEVRAREDDDIPHVAVADLALQTTLHVTQGRPCVRVLHPQTLGFVLHLFNVRLERRRFLLQSTNQSTNHGSKKAKE